jgi:hypothetical protein
MPGMNRKGSGGAGANTGRGSGICRQSGDSAAQGQGMARKGSTGPGGCRRQQDGVQGQGRGRGCKILPVGVGGTASDSPAKYNKAATGRSVQAVDPNQQALDEIMEAVRQTELHPEGKL